MNIDAIRKKLEIINAGYVLMTTWTVVDGLLRLYMDAREGTFGRRFSVAVTCPERTKDNINLYYYEEECINRLYEDMYSTLYPREKNLVHMMDGLAKFLDEQK